MPIIAAIFVFVGFLFFRSFILFPPFPGPDPCAGVAHPAKALCQKYCTAENCDEQDGHRAVCRKLRFDLVRLTGRHFFPCDIFRPLPQPPTEPEATATLEPEATATSTVVGTVEPSVTETPAFTETETPTPTFTPIDTVTATSASEGVALEQPVARSRSRQLILRSRPERGE
jgi:hypothetical protein